MVSIAKMARLFVLAALAQAMTMTACLAETSLPAPVPDKVSFMSNDGRTLLAGYVFKPQGGSARHPAVVMMHGRAGAYSSRAQGIYDASTLTKRHLKWGYIWARQGYLAILVDGFGPRGYPQGFPKSSYDARPDALDEVTVRPLDANGALSYLRTREDVLPERIALQGWSNGGSAVLATMSDDKDTSLHSSKAGFVGALAFYPGCGLKGRFRNGLMPYAPVRVFQGSADEEVSPQRCSKLIQDSRANGADIEFRLYDGATHDFDSPDQVRQDDPANVAADLDVVSRATEFFKAVLRN